MIWCEVSKAPTIPKYWEFLCIYKKCEEKHSCSVNTEGVQCWVVICCALFLWKLLPCFEQDTVVMETAAHSSRCWRFTLIHLFCLRGDTPVCSISWIFLQPLLVLQIHKLKPRELQLWCVGNSGVQCCVELWASFFPHKWVQCLVHRKLCASHSRPFIILSWQRSRLFVYLEIFYFRLPCCLSLQ